MSSSDIEGLTKELIYDLLRSMGEKLGFAVHREVHTGVSKVDLAWFDKRLHIDWFKKPKTRELKIEGTMLIPVVGFEVQEKSAVRKILRGDIDSLNSLHPLLGVLVLSRLIKKTHYNRQLKVTGSKAKAMERAENWFKTDISFATRVASMNPYRRIVVTTDDQIIELAHKIGV